MLEFIQQYWLETLFTTILTIFTFVGKTLYSRVKKELKAYATKHVKPLSLVLVKYWEMSNNGSMLLQPSR